MRFPPSPSRRGAAIFGVLAVLATGSTPVGADDAVTDLDRRATMALWNSTTAEATPFQLKDIGPDNVKRLALYKPVAENGGREYAIRFGVQEADGSGRGFHKIVIGGTTSDPSKKDWVLVSSPKDPACQIWQKRVDRSDAERYVEWACRGAIGPVVLNVVDRRRLSESPDAAQAPLLARYRRLLDAAKGAGLFAKAKATLYLSEGEDSGVVLGEAEPLVSLSSEGRRYPLRLEMTDPEDRPVEAKWFRITLSGPLASYATLDGAKVKPGTSDWLVSDPGLVATVYVVLPAPTPAMEQALVEHDESGSKDPTLSIAVAARRK